MLLLCPPALRKCSRLSSCTSKGILEETDANNLNINPTISGALQQAVGAVWGENASLISLGMDVAPKTCCEKVAPPLSADEGRAGSL